jgi:hypothetical protein
MIVTPRFVFLHLHKSGGTFVNECLLRYVPGARAAGYHLPHTMIPAAAAVLPVLGLVRNPWSYYVSWFAFQSAMRQPNALFRVLSDDGRLDFAGTITNMVGLSRDPERLARVVAALPAHYTGRGLNMPGPVLARIADAPRPTGFYSFLFDYMFDARAERRCLGRMESLRDDLPRLLETVGQPVGDALRAHLATAAPVNASAHGDYRGYYTDEVAELVARHDALVIERFGYRFGD